MPCLLIVSMYVFLIIRLIVGHAYAKFCPQSRDSLRALSHYVNGTKSAFVLESFLKLGYYLALNGFDNLL